MKGALARLIATHAQPGRIEWIGLRPSRLKNICMPSHAMLGVAGLEGDHGRQGKRALTLLQAEHLPVIAALLGIKTVAPDLLRRNLVISGINLTALRGQTLRIGTARFTLTGPCAPCSRMEHALGRGGYTALRGHGGWCASVVTSGRVALGDLVEVDTDDTN